MKKKAPPSKLTLTRQTLNHLQLEEVRGGGALPGINPCRTNSTCPACNTKLE